MDAAARCTQRTTLEIALEEFPDAFLLVDKKGFICYANKKAKGEFETEKRSPCR